MKILCKTYFDCSCTGVTGNYKSSQIPFVDRIGQPVTNQRLWHHSRNQQRNWETINQLIGLRTQPISVSMSKVDQNIWSFEFEVEHSEVYSKTADNNDLSLLLEECQNVPMIIGLNESLTSTSMLITSGPDQNIWFEAINIDKELTNG
jgi:hypothetical protein